MTVNSNGSFTFSTPVAQGATYNVTVLTQPATQTCTATNGSGTVGTSNITNVQVTCSVNTYTVGGTITGLVGSVSLKNNGGDTLTQSTDGSFTFPTSIAEGSTYNVTVSSQPATQTCTVSNGAGSMGGANITNVQVTCSVNTYTVGGTITGLVGSVSLKNNGGDTLTQSTDGSFTFPTSIAEGSTYNVTVSSQPATQTCTVSNGAGSMGGANITNVQVTCSVNTYTVGGTITGLVGSVSLKNNGGDTITQSMNGSFTFPTPVAAGSTYHVTVSSQPIPLTCTVSNAAGTVGSSNVTNVQITCTIYTTPLSVNNGIIPVNSGSGTITIKNTGANTAYNVHVTLPSGWTGMTQDASNCTSIAPNNGTCTVTFTTTTPYVAQANISVVGDNISNTPTTRLAFSVQGYLVWNVSSLTTVEVVDNVNQATSVGWGFWGTAIGSGAQSLTDGSGNTNAIVGAVGIDTTYAAVLCYQSTHGGASVGSWYLPAICQMGNSSMGAGCPAGLANLYTNLAQLGLGNLTTYTYWSSTEYSSGGHSPYWSWGLNYASILEAPYNKSLSANVRCVQRLTY